MKVTSKSDIPENRIPKGFLYNKRKCEKDECDKEGIYSSKLGYFCLDHILDYDMMCPNAKCPRNGLAMDKIIQKIEKDMKGDLHQVFLCQACNYRHDHTVHV
jgi:transposase-like protein